MSFEGGILLDGNLPVVLSRRTVYRVVQCLAHHILLKNIPRLIIFHGLPVVSGLRIIICLHAKSF